MWQVADLWKFIKSDEEHTPATRFDKSYGYYEIYNAAMFIADDNKIDKYKKSKLVIGAETTPFTSVFKMFMNDLGGRVGNLGSQDTATVFFNSKGTGISGAICYESVYGEYIGQFVRKGANIIGIITNDGWWFTSPAHKQHFAYARLRAIEHRRYVARAANTGISAIINPLGESVGQIPYGTMGAYQAEVSVLTEQSIYTQYGDYIARLSVFIWCMLLLGILAQNIKKSNLFS